jgi:hypothetical protein
MAHANNSVLLWVKRGRPTVYHVISVPSRKETCAWRTRGAGNKSAVFSTSAMAERTLQWRTHTHNSTKLRLNTGSNFRHAIAYRSIFLVGVNVTSVPVTDV